ncbi:hypothetical protein AUQ37_03320 [Candidatus Methanomethylophilus sp. 1R26]|uniref:dTDP-4-dehydrorhamnose reductase n=1 Tax=Candidatus Methanomethylophilus sp. 1R26 TaxID=1769296 RepID=UPI00073637A2|nr:dTDP-4-dehydrorhamnose reductase [Candidatus Methanomethylophilus sp. 1R26]KUE73140.1 hypothetical protein AUQ37_03320 [Candidatus Methanomethylophilus sp. 1R26]
MRVLVTGAGGQLGHDVTGCLKIRGDTAIAPSHEEMDITDRSAVDACFARGHPDAVIHCAAWTAVDLAETHEAECRNVNVNGTMNLTEACRSAGIPILYVSTDYVFDGTLGRPITVDDPTCPVNVYGFSKRDGETVVRTYHRHYIVRTSWVFGSSGRNFVKTMLSLAQKTDTVKVVDDQIGSPTYTADLAPLLCRIIGSGKYGTYHAHNAGYCSWCGFARGIFSAAGVRTQAVPISTREYPTAARRPPDSRLDTSSLTEAGFGQLPEWQDAVARYVRSNPYIE